MLRGEGCAWWRIGRPAPWPRLRIPDQFQPSSTRIPRLPSIRSSRDGRVSGTRGTALEPSTSSCPQTYGPGSPGRCRPRGGGPYACSWASCSLGSRLRFGCERGRTPGRRKLAPAAGAGASASWDGSRARRTTGYLSRLCPPPPAETPRLLRARPRCPRLAPGTSRGGNAELRGTEWGPAPPTINPATADLTAIHRLAATRVPGAVRPGSRSRTSR